MMSLQRMFDLVRRQGMPLVVSDGQGNEPVIVLPLGVYEALLDGQSEIDRAARSGIQPDEPVMVPVRDESTSSAESHAVSTINPELQRMSQPPKPQVETDLLAELSMEERFYIDSMDGDNIS